MLYYDIKILYKINKTTKIVVDTVIGNTENIKITEAVQQNTIFGPAMCCATTSKVNEKKRSL